MNTKRDNRSKKAIVIGTAAAITTGIFFFIGDLLSKKKVGDKLDTKIKVMVHSINLSGVILRIDVTLINPTEGTLTIRQPYIKVLFNNKEVGTTELKDQKVIILPFKPKPLDPIYLTIPVTGLLSLGGGLLSLLVQKKPAQITTKILTSIYIAGGFKSYEKTDVMNLKPKTV